MYLIRPCLIDDIPIVDEFFSNVVFKEEPLVSANGPHVIPPVEESLSAVVIPQGRSVLAESADEIIIGACLNDEPPQDFPNIYTNTKEDVKFQKMFQYIEDVSDVLDIAPNALEVRLMAVNNNWRNKGVASALLQATESVARTANFPWLKIYCTSCFSSTLACKLGWKKIFSLSYKEYINNFPSGIRAPTEPHTHCDLYIKKIEF